MTAVSASRSASGIKRRILFVAACPFPAPRGTPARIYRMAEELGCRGHDVHVATYHLGQPVGNVPFTIHRIANIPTYRKMDPGPSYQKLAVVDPLLALKIVRVAANTCPDVIHAHHYEGLLTAWPARSLCRIPLVFDEHVLLQGELQYYSIGFSSRLRRGVARYFDAHLPRRADHIVSISEEIRERLCDDHGYDRRQITVVPNGVEEAFFRGRAVAFPRDGMKRLIFTGNLAGYQGAELMLDAFARIVKARDDVRLVVVTDSDSTEFCEWARARGVLERIEFRVAGLAELPDLLASADVALNPRTLCSGVPMKLLNYMAAGRAIVSFVGSAKYLVDGYSGRVIEDGDTAQFAGAVLSLLDDGGLARQLGAEARAYAERNLTWSRTAVALENVYDRIIAAFKSRRRTARHAVDAARHGGVR